MSPPKRTIRHIALGLLAVLALRTSTATTTAAEPVQLGNRLFYDTGHTLSVLQAETGFASSRMEPSDFSMLPPDPMIRASQLLHGWSALPLAQANVPESGLAPTNLPRKDESPPLCFEDAAFVVPQEPAGSNDADGL